MYGNPRKDVTTELQVVATHVLAAALKPATTRSYLHYWERFVYFVSKILLFPFILPLDTHVFIMFLSYLFDQSLSYSTILYYVGAINYHLKLRSLPDYSDSIIVMKIYEGSGKFVSPSGIFIDNNT